MKKNASIYLRDVDIETVLETSSSLPSYLRLDALHLSNNDTLVFYVQFKVAPSCGWALTPAEEPPGDTR